MFKYINDPLTKIQKVQKTMIPKTASKLSKSNFAEEMEVSKQQLNTATLQKMSEERISKKTEVGLTKVEEKIANRNGNQNACSETVEKYSIEYTNCKNETEDQSVREELFRYR